MSEQKIEHFDDITYLDNRKKETCPHRFTASQGQTTTKKWREKNKVICEHCGSTFWFCAEVGYFYHP